MRVVVAAAVAAMVVACSCVPAAATVPVDAGAVLQEADRRARPSFQIMYRWPSRTITFHNRAPKYKREVAQAVALWNSSGAGVRWRAVPAGRARVSIRMTDRIAPFSGLATVRLGGAPRALIDLRSNLFSYGGSRAERRVAAIGVIAHEMGHVMGLGHEDRRCAVMNSSAGINCPRPKEPWRYRCRVLTRDDVLGAIKLFQGRVRLKREFCDLVAEPPAVEDLIATPSPDGSGALISWRNPAHRGMTLDVVRRNGGSCASALGGSETYVLESVKAGAPGSTQSVTDLELEVGDYCYSVIPSARERPGKAVSAHFTYAGQAPFVDFEATPFGDGNVEFYDLSSDPESDIVSYSWSFGDGSGSAETNPVHTYAAPGTYMVTLTVTDAAGHSTSATKAVTAE